jgi:SOS-response transcriptional repressor LexA
MKALTSKEKKVLAAISHLQNQLGQSPSYREIMHELAYTSTGSIYRFVHSLIKKGYLISEGKGWRSLSTKVEETNDTIDIIGNISKKRPPSLFEQPKKTHIPRHFLSSNGSLYGLYVEDASFTEEFLMPQDLLIIQAGICPQGGDLVLASTESTIIGRYHEEDNEHIRFVLNPYAHAAEASTLILPATSVQIWGLIIGLLREYSHQR